MTETPVRQRSRARAINVESQEGMIVVRRTCYGDETEETQETVRVPVFETDSGRLRVNGGITRNMGDHNFVKVEVMLELPVLPVMSEVDRVYDMVTRWVDARIQQELDEAMNREHPNGSNDANPNTQPQDDGVTAAGIRRRVRV